jgi:hypothetical protein
MPGFCFLLGVSTRNRYRKQARAKAARAKAAQEEAVRQDRIDRQNQQNVYHNGNQQTTY